MITDYYQQELKSRAAHQLGCPAFVWKSGAIRTTFEKKKKNHGSDSILSYEK